MSQRRIEKAFGLAFRLLIPRKVENAVQRAAQSAQDVLWQQEQEYLRRFPLFLRGHNMKVYDVHKKDSRGFWRLHYKIDYIRD